MGSDLDEIKAEYFRSVKLKILFLAILILIIIGLIGIAICSGVIHISIEGVFRILIDRFYPNHFHVSEIARQAVWEIRLPRALFGVLAGFGLGIAGAVMQVVLKNPLASPYTLGLSSAAGFGAALAILFGHGFLQDYLITGNAFIFALLASLVTIGIARMKGTSTEIMVLSGIAIMFFFSACTTFMEYFADPEAIKGVVFWMVGNLGKASWDKLVILFVVFLTSTSYLIWKAWDLDIISSGDETAKSLGIDVERLRTMCLVVVSLLVGCIVSFSGTIGFIGLVGPHIVRMIIGSDNKFVLPASALAGGILLLGADIVAQRILSPVILPIGVMTAFMGIPLFFYLILKRRANY